MFILTFYLNVFTFKTTKTELQNLYNTEFNDCKILEIIKKQYPSAGYYALFSVDCTSGYFPILLENMTSENESYFDKGIIISKGKDTYRLTLKSEENTFEVISRHPDNEIGLGPVTRVLILLIVVFVIIIQFFIPDHYYKFNKYVS
jgi:hypothetical protein